MRITIDSTFGIATCRNTASKHSSDRGRRCANVFYTVKAAVNALWRNGLRLIEIRTDQLHAINKVLDALAINPLRFVLFIDDLSVLKDDNSFRALKRRWKAR